MKPFWLYNNKPNHTRYYLTTIVLITVLFSCWFAGTYQKSRTFAARNSVIPRAQKWPDMPNIVHYVYAMRMPDAHIEFELRHFIAVYSAYLYFSPDVIYIHTDASKEAIAKAMSSAADAPNIWTYRIFNLPRVQVRKLVIPETPSQGEELAFIEHRSDLIRPQVLHESGGMYFDFDIYPIRDFAPLREAGYANIMGLKARGRVNNGHMISVKGSHMMRLFNKYQNIVYDGKWLTHSVELLTKLSRRMSLVPGEVIILDKPAFAPSSWRKEDIKTLFGNTNVTRWEEPATVDTPTMADSNSPLDPYETLWLSPTSKDKKEYDYSETYGIHAYRISDQNPPVGLPYLLSPQSNFAKAVYPVVKHAVDAGLISVTD